MVSCCLRSNRRLSFRGIRADFLPLLFLIPCALLAGCAFAPVAPTTPEVVNGPALQGGVFGGRQAVIGARIYLLAANQGVYGTQSTSLLNAALTGQSDPIGAYVTSGGVGGSFSVTGMYTCTVGQPVYLLALGGNSGAGTNTKIGLMAALGACPAAGNFLVQTPYVTINEVTTVAAAYAMSGFAKDATHVAYSGSTSATTGVQNAFANAANMAKLVNGTAYATTPGGNGIVPQSEINTLANILASCVNCSDTAPGQCPTIFAKATADGTTGGTQPTETASAAINIVHNPLETSPRCMGWNPALSFTHRISLLLRLTSSSRSPTPAGS